MHNSRQQVPSTVPPPFSANLQNHLTAPQCSILLPRAERRRPYPTSCDAPNNLSSRSPNARIKLHAVHCRYAKQLQLLAVTAAPPQTYNLALCPTPPPNPHLPPNRQHMPARIHAFTTRASQQHTVRQQYQHAFPHAHSPALSHRIVTRYSPALPPPPRRPRCCWLRAFPAGRSPAWPPPAPCCRGSRGRSIRQRGQTAAL